MPFKSLLSNTTPYRYDNGQDDYDQQEMEAIRVDFEQSEHVDIVAEHDMQEWMNAICNNNF